MDEELVGNRIVRQSTLNPIGRSLVRVCLRAQRAESALDLVQWGGPDTQGRGPCPACSRFPAQGHDEACFIAQALRHRDPLGHAEETIRFVRDLVRSQQHMVESHADMIKITLSELQQVMDDAAQFLGRL